MLLRTELFSKCLRRARNKAFTSPIGTFTVLPYAAVSTPIARLMADHAEPSIHGLNLAHFAKSLGEAPESRCTAVTQNSGYIAAP